MKLFRFGPEENERPGVELTGGRRVDVSAFGQDYDETFLATNGLERLADWLKTNESQCPQVDADARLASCVKRPSKIVCVGLNYAKHAAETNAPIPTEPILFFKATTALAGPNDNVVIPKRSEKTDWEVELAIIIGKKATYVSKDDAFDYIAGYAVHNDYSERAWQLERGGQWVKGKSCDGFGPIGPWLVTRDEVPDPQNLRMWLEVNGRRF